MRLSFPKSCSGIHATTGLFLAFFCLAGTFPAPAQEKKAETSVLFLEGRPFAEILKKARSEKKPIMIDAFATWCGPCKMMDRTTFADPDVASWARKSVIAVKYDAEKGEGRKVAA